jgi:quercetin dioxygenase-like cupin family protein
MGFFELDAIEIKEPVPGFKVRFIHSENMTLAYWTVEPGAVLPEHSHIHEQVTNIIQGDFELTVEEKTKVLTKDSVAVIPSDAVHSGKALTRCKIIDAFYPVREDYR